MQEGFAAPHTFKLQTFEGPLDLLLHLIRINEIDILDIPIVEITDQYLQYLDLLKEIDIDLSSEFMLMAATLIHIKTKTLLPHHDEEAEELREELVQRLLEHEQYRAAAAALAHRENREILHWKRPDSVMEPYMQDKEVYFEADLFQLISAFQRVLTALGADSSMEVEHRQYSVEDKMKEIQEALKKDKKVLFSTFSKRFKVRRELIAVFLAILELMRRRKLLIMQSSAFGEIVLVRAAGKPERK